MSHLSEAVGGFVIVAAAVGTAFAVFPRTAGPRPMPVVLEPMPARVERAKQMPERTDAERIDALQERLGEIAAAQEQVAEDLEAIAKRERAK